MTWATGEALNAKLEAFALVLHEAQAAEIRRRFPALDAEEEARITIKPGPKWIKVDVFRSVKYMVEKTTGNIYGIKAYGVPQKAPQYGTLATIAEWYWGGYAAVVRRPKQCARCLEFFPASALVRGLCDTCGGEVAAERIHP